MPITKHSYLVTRAADISRALAEAFHIASTGRPGPVLVDISKDALTAGPTSPGRPRSNCPDTGPSRARTASRSGPPPT